MLGVLTYANSNCGSLAVLIILNNVELAMKTWHQTYSGRNFKKKIVSSYCYLKSAFMKVFMIDYVFGYQRVKKYTCISFTAITCLLMFCLYE